MSAFVAVRLTESEVAVGQFIGRLRQEAAEQRGLADKHGLAPSQGGKGLELHVEGACGEIAFAKATGRYWPMTVNTFKEGDDVVGYQVRTRSKHWYDLLIRADDDPAKGYVLVTGTRPEYRVWGWCYGRDAQEPEYEQALPNGRPPCFLVPKAALLPVPGPRARLAA